MGRTTGTEKPPARLPVAVPAKEDLLRTSFQAAYAKHEGLPSIEGDEAVRMYDNWAEAQEFQTGQQTGMTVLFTGGTAMMNPPDFLEMAAKHAAPAAAVGFTGAVTTLGVAMIVAQMRWEQIMDSIEARPKLVDASDRTRLIDCLHRVEGGDGAGRPGVDELLDTRRAAAPALR